jgi:hypothetical protein
VFCFFASCRNHTTWRNNPQFFLTVKEKTSVTIKMRHDLTPPNSIGFYILSSVNGIVSHTIINASTTVTVIYTSAQ